MKAKNILLILLATCTISSSSLLLKTTSNYKEATLKNVELKSEISTLNKTLTDLEYAKSVVETNVDTLENLCVQYEDEIKNMASEITLLNAQKEEKIEENVEIEVATKTTYTEDDVNLLAGVIYAENGCEWFPSVVQLMTGSVVLNRMKHEFYPDSLYDVIHQPGQYGCVPTGAYLLEPSEEAIANARYLLENGSILPPDVIYQAEFTQGSGVYFEFYDPVLDTTNYFCYQ